MRVVIVESPGDAVVGVVEDWPGPVPHAGEYIFHPPSGGRPETNVMRVKTVTYRMLTRPVSGAYFTAHPEPYIQIHV